MSLTAALLSLHFRDLHHYIPFSAHADLSLLLFCLVFVILAYATNPSEASFRIFLTELSFRHHLSRLDHSSDDREAAKTSQNGLHSTSNGINNSPSSFQFANRASLSLRTPKHVFHSFGIFTIAAIVPLTRAEREALNASLDRDGSMISDSWFIGAFGRWWRGGIIEAWYQDVVARPSPEEGRSSGILGMKALDRLHGHHGLPFAHRNPSLLGPTKGPPPRLRNRERPAQRNTISALRSTTPPPLPKSVTLPLHAPRSPPSTPERPSPTIAPTGSPVSNRLPATHLDQSPHITDLRRQITTAKASANELRGQFVEIQAGASELHASLQSELDSVRERRRQEDSAKSELKSRTKALDDSKRLAEGSKRDAEKRLKAAQTARDDAAHRIHRLETEISHLKDNMVSDKDAIQDSNAESLEVQNELEQTLIHKKKEIKVAEDVVAALSFRAKELEEKVSNAKERLDQLRDRNQDPLVYPRAPSSPWSPMLFGTSEVGSARNSVDLSEYLGLHPPGSPQAAESLASSPRPTRLSLGSLSNFHSGHSTSGTLGNGRSNAYPTFAQSLAPASTTSSGFTVFDDDALRIPPTPGGPMSPAGQSLITSGLMHSLDINESPKHPLLGFKLSPVGRTWQNGRSHENLTAPPASAPSSEDRDPFEVRMPPADQRRRMASETGLDASMLALSRSRSIPEGNEAAVHLSGARRWFSTLGKTPKGLNPDAREFSFAPRSPSSLMSSTNDAMVYDTLNPHGVLMARDAPTTSNSMLRAFAPSPAEREALQRALGGSTNASLEKLPSLSDVGSIPSSPVHADTQAAPTESSNGRDFVKSLPSWLQMPKSRKTNFSPWADEDPTPTQESKEQSTPW